MPLALGSGNKPPTTLGSNPGSAAYWLCDCGQLLGACGALLGASQSLINKPSTPPSSHGLRKGYKAVPGMWPVNVSPGFSQTGHLRLRGRELRPLTLGSLYTIWFLQQLQPQPPGI